MKKIFTFLLVGTSLISWAQSIPTTNQTVNLTEEITDIYTFDKSIRFNANPESEFSLIYMGAWAELDVLVLNGNIRVSNELICPKVYILPGEQIIHKLHSNDTVYNYGHLTFNRFSSDDTMVVVNYPGATLTYLDQHNTLKYLEAVEGEYYIGDCNKGIMYVIQEDFPTHLPSIPEKNTYTDYFLTDINGKAVSQGKYQVDMKFKVPLTGIYVVRLYNSKHSISFKQFINH